MEAISPAEVVDDDLAVQSTPESPQTSTVNVEVSSLETAARETANMPPPLQVSFSQASEGDLYYIALPPIGVAPVTGTGNAVSMSSADLRSEIPDSEDFSEVSSVGRVDEDAVEDVIALDEDASSADVPKQASEAAEHKVAEEEGDDVSEHPSSLPSPDKKHSDDESEEISRLQRSALDVLALSPSGKDKAESPTADTVVDEDQEASGVDEASVGLKNGKREIPASDASDEDSDEIASPLNESAALVLTDAGVMDAIDEDSDEIASPLNESAALVLTDAGVTDAIVPSPQWEPPSVVLTSSPEIDHEPTYTASETLPLEEERGSTACPPNTVTVPSVSNDSTQSEDTPMVDSSRTLIPTASVEPPQQLRDDESSPVQPKSVKAGISKRSAPGTSFPASQGSQNKDVYMAELKSMKMSSIQSRNSSLETELANKRVKLEEITKDLKNPPAETVKKHIKLLHDYNDIRDVGQGLIGIIAENRGVRIGELYDEFGVGLKD